jgi:hypothetical protein
MKTERTKRPAGTVEVPKDVQSDLAPEIEISNDGPIAPIVKMTNEELAREIICAVSKELHIRVGIGPIWRQLNEARKKELLDKWQYEAELILSENR